MIPRRMPSHNPARTQHRSPPHRPSPGSSDFDFFLLSHAGLKGTSKPSYYRVLRDEARMNVDDLQQFTFYLCHNYSRCTRSVSVVPAVYYSHLAAKRAQIFREYIVGSCHVLYSCSTQTYATGSLAPMVHDVSCCSPPTPFLFCHAIRLRTRWEALCRGSR
jgi:hypothetical protein